VTVAEVTGACRGTASVTYTLAETRRFDFNGQNNWTESNFWGVRGTDTYSVTRGYGWTVAQLEFERASGTLLQKDGHYGSGSGGGTFRIPVEPNQPYWVKVHVGDASFGRDQIQVSVEGTAPYTIASLAAGVWDSTIVTGIAGDGLLDVTIRDLGGNMYWVVNGLEVTAQPEIVMRDQDGAEIPDNDGSFVFDSTVVDTPADATFTIQNTAAGSLTLAGLQLPSGFSLIGQFPAAVAPYSASTFQVRLTATALGLTGKGVRNRY
jgi:hypothetical protein